MRINTTVATVSSCATVSFILAFVNITECNNVVFLTEVRYIVPDYSGHDRVERSAEYSPYIFPEFGVPIYDSVASSFYVSS